MVHFLRVSGSMLSVAGLVWEGINARKQDPYLLSTQSIVFTFLYAILLFVVNLRSFKRIELNCGRFSFDSHIISGSMYPMKDRTRGIVKILGLGQIPTPEQ